MAHGPFATWVERLATVQVVSATAYTKNGEVAMEPMRQLWNYLYEAGIRVFIPCAGSAEFHSLTSHEIAAIVGAAKKSLPTDAVVIAPVGGALPFAIETAERCVTAGADALLIMPLDFPYISDAGARDYYLQFWDRIHTPTLIYKKGEIPSDSLILALSEIMNFIGVKYAIADIAAFQRIVEESGGRLAWFCGLAERYAPYFALAGAIGYTSGAANICPRVSLALHRALQHGQWQEALRWQRVILPIEYYRARQGNSYNVTFLKYALHHRGWDFGLPRPPQRRLTGAEMEEIDRLLAPILEEERRLAARTSSG